MGEVFSYSLESVRRVLADARRSGVRYASFSKMVPEWQFSPLDPHKVLAAFGPLRLKRGYRLHAYLYSGRFGVGVVWATRERAIRPPSECDMIRRSHHGPPVSYPRPAGAIDDLMAAIAGDAAPWTYACASLFAREIHWLGAHGLGLTLGPLVEWLAPLKRVQVPGGDVAGWRRLVPQPYSLGLTVATGAGREHTTVTLYAISGLQSDMLLRQVDTYHAKSLQCTTTSETVANARYAERSG